MEVGNIVWIDGTSPAIVVGLGVNNDNNSDGRIFAVRLGDAEVIEPNDEGAYPFGSVPYDVDAGSDRNAAANPGGFGADSPALPSSTQQDGVTYDDAGAASTTQGGAAGTPSGEGTNVVAFGAASDDSIALDERERELDERERAIAERERETDANQSTTETTASDAPPIA